MQRVEATNVILDLTNTPERDAPPIHSCQSGKQNRFCISVGIEGKVRSSTGYAAQPEGVGPGIGVFMDLV